MKKGAILGVIGCFFIAGNVLASTEKSFVPNFFMNYKPHYYKWEEKGVDVKEKGWLHEAEMGINVNYHSFVFTPSFSISGGEVDYDGSTWGGAPVSSKTDYSGWSLKLDVGKNFKFSNIFKITPYVTLGQEYWKRHLENTLSSLGYSEKWTVRYVGLGIKPAYNIGLCYAFGNLYAKYNFDIKNKAELFDVTVKPGKAWGYGIEVGLGIKSFLKKGLNPELSAFYTYDKFKASPWKYSSVLGDYVRQPESVKKIIGIKLGVKF